MYLGINDLKVFNMQKEL